MAFPTPWFVNVTAVYRMHLDLPHIIDSRSRINRVERFRHEFAARERAAELGEKTAMELHKWIRINHAPAGRALLDPIALLPLNSELIEVTVTWGSRGAAGKAHGEVTIPHDNEVAVMRDS